METILEFLVKIDQTIFFLINGGVGTHTLLDSAARIIAGDYLIPVSFSLVLIFIWFREDTLSLRVAGREAVLKSISTLLAACFLVLVLNGIVFRERPFNLPDSNLIFYAPTDSSFPSNSVAAVMGMALPIFSSYKVLGRIMIFASFCLGFGRILVGIHFPGDVVGGLLVALMSFWITVRLFHIFNRQIITLIILLEKAKWLQVFRI